MNNGDADQSGNSEASPHAPGCGKVHPIDWAIEAKAVDEIWRETQIKVQRRRRRRLQVVTGSLAAALVLAAFLGQAFQAGRNSPEATGESMAAIGAALLVPEQHILPDGSKVDLKPGAEMRVTYSASSRRIELQRGEAHFQVTKDPRRPFVVQAGGVEVRAVGTAFSVQLESRQVDVMVTEGQVAVERAPLVEARPAGPTPALQSLPALTMVEAGRRVVVERHTTATNPPPVVAAVTATEIAERLAWRAPRLDFTRTPLSEALPIINQHSRVQVVLGDPALGKVRLSGILRADNVDTLLRLLEAEHGLRAEWHGDAEVVLQRAP